MVIHATKVDYRNAFAGLVFPASKDQIVLRSRTQGGIDREVFAILASIPTHSYHSMEQLEDAIRGVYIVRGESPDELPV